MSTDRLSKIFGFLVLKGYLWIIWVKIGRNLMDILGKNLIAH